MSEALRDFMKDCMKEDFEKAKKEGREEGRMDLLKALLAQGIITPQQAIQFGV